MSDIEKEKKKKKMNDIAIEYSKLLESEKMNNKKPEEFTLEDYSSELKMVYWELYMCIIDFYEKEDNTASSKTYVDKNNNSKQELISEFTLKKIQNFDPKKNKDFYSFMVGIFNYVSSDIKNINNDVENNNTDKITSEKQVDQETGQVVDVPLSKTKYKRVPRVYLDDDDSESDESESNISAENEFIYNEYVNDTNFKYILLLLNFQSKMTKRTKNNDSTIYNFCCFFAEQIATIVKSGICLDTYLLNQVAIFDTINTDFMKFFMGEKINNIEHLLQTVSKEYEKYLLKPGLNLPNKVHIEYRKARNNNVFTSPSSVSEAKKAFINFIDKNISKE